MYENEFGNKSVFIFNATKYDLHNCVVAIAV